MNQEAWPAWATEEVHLVEYDPAWADAGAQECARLQRLLQPWRTGAVEHVGSTAVPGLRAKPILDLQAPVRDFDVADAIAAALADHDWHYVPLHVDQRPNRRFYVLVADDHRVAHLHVLETDGERWRDQLRFRDALRADPALRQAYADLKTELAARHHGDREAYTDAKRHFVDEVLAPTV